MKNIFTFLALLFLTSTAFAFQTKLSATSLSKTNIRIDIDGRSYYLSNNGRFDNAFTLDDISVGLHRIAVYKQQQRKRGGWGNNNNSYQVIYQGNFFVKNLYHTDIVITRFDKVYIDEMYAQQISGGNNGGFDNQAMDVNSFANLKQLVSKETFDNNKLNVIKLAAGYNYFSTNQVKELMQQFSFDNAKLDVAKFLLNRVVDRQNFYLLVDQFTFTNTKDDFKEYVQNH